MELGQYQIQVFISLVVILSAACITAICEFVKNREQSAAQNPAPTVHARTAAETAVSNPRAKSIKRMREKRSVAPEALAAMERGQKLAVGTEPAGSKLRAEKPVEVHPVVLSEVPLRGEQIEEPVVEAEPVTAAAPAMKEVVPAIPELAAVVDVVEAAVIEPEPVAPIALVEAALVEVALVEVVPVEVAPVVPEVVEAAPAAVEPSAPAAPAKRNWGAVLTSSKVNQTPRTAPTGERVILAIRQPMPSLPAGFQDGIVLTKMVQNRQPVSGLVVSVGVQPRNGHAVPERVDEMIQSLLGPGDFAARVSEREYLLIFPAERGASAELRLADISDRLADRAAAMDNYEVLFNCGGLEVRSEAIDEAIASANQRMEEVGRNRKILTMPDSALRRAV